MGNGKGGKLYPPTPELEYPMKLRPLVEQICGNTILTKKQAAVLVAKQAGYDCEDIAKMTTISEIGNVKRLVRAAWGNKIVAESTFSLFEDIRTGAFLQDYPDIGPEEPEEMEESDGPRFKVKVDKASRKENLRQELKRKFRDEPKADISEVMEIYDLDDRDFVKEVRKEAWSLL